MSQYQAYILDRTLHSYHKWTEPKPAMYSSLWSRVVSWWGVAKPIAKQLPSYSSYTWAPHSQSFTLQWHYIQGKKIILETLCNEIVEEDTKMTQSLLDILPFLDLSTFSLSSIFDQAESEASLFDDAQNKALFQPYIDKLWLYF